MCQIGKCTWTYYPPHRLYRCQKCLNFITDKDIHNDPRKYTKYKFRTKCFGGPLDGKQRLSLPFGTKYFWVGFGLVFLSYDASRQYNQYEYELEPFGSFVFVRVRPRILSKGF